MLALTSVLPFQCSYSVASLVQLRFCSSQTWTIVWFPPFSKLFTVQGSAPSLTWQGAVSSSISQSVSPSRLHLSDDMPVS